MTSGPTAGTGAGTAAPADPVEPAAPTTRATRFDLLVVGLTALVIRIPAFLSPRSLVFDDGVFGASVIAMRAGGLPFRDVFSSQGPLFLPLAWFGDLVTFRTIDSPRTISVVSGVAIALAAYAAGREITSRRRALLAAGLVIVSGSVLWTSGPLAADGPANAFALITVAVALGYRRSPSTARAVVIGLLAGAAFSVKSLLVLPALVTVGVVVVSRRRRADILAVPGVAITVAVIVSLPWGLERVIEQSVLYHTDAITSRVPLDNIEVVARTLVTRDLPLVVAGVAAIAAWLWPRSTARASPGDHGDLEDLDDFGAPPPRRVGWIERLGAGRAPLVVWAVLVGAVLISESPMWRSHVAHLVPPLALLIASARGSWRTTAVAAALAVPVSLVSLHPLVWPAELRRSEATVERALRSLPPGAMVISDTPGLVWRAGRRTPDRYVDTSILRITSPRADLRIAEDDVVRDATSPRVCAVVRWSSERFGSFRDLGPRLRREGYVRRFSRMPAPRALWIKEPCRPHGPPPAWPADRARRTSGAAAPGRSRG